MASQAGDSAELASLEKSSKDRQSPEGGPERKRRRKVLSCQDCRRRKLQCDRALPACGRCTKGGHADSCLYLDEPSDGASEKVSVDGRGRSSGAHTMAETSLQPRVSLTPLARLEYQDRRIKQLEAALMQAGLSTTDSSAGSGLMLAPEAVVDRTAPIVDHESVSLRGRAFKTQFSGSTHPGNMISHLNHLEQFTKEAFTNFPAIRRMRNEVHALDEKLSKDDTELSPVGDEDIKKALLGKAETDELVHLYIDTFDSIYHIIHLPTFWKAYDDMWEDLQVASAHFVAIVLLMMACVTCLVSSDEISIYSASSSVPRSQSISWISHCDDWIARQSQKHVTAADFQIRALLWLAKQTSARKYKRTWTDAGTLLRFCMSAGLHRNPDLLPKQTSELDKELRRRIWATAVDFELQASFDRGMVSAPWLLQSDTTGPSNIFDKDIGDTVPTARPLSEFTPAAYLALANNSLMLRSTLNAVLNNIRQKLSFDEVKQYTEEIESHLASIPDWTDRRSDMPKALLHLRLRQYLLVIHDRNLRQAKSMAEKNFSKLSLLENSLQMVETHKSLLADQKFALELYCADAVRVAVSLAHLQVFISQQSDLAFARTFDMVTPQVMNDLVAIARDRVLRFGREGRYLWIVLSCDGIIKATRHPAQRSVFIQQSVDNMLSPMYKVLSSQEKDLTSVAQTNGVPASYLPTGQDQTLLDPTILDLDDLAEWTLQDWFTINEYSTLPGTNQDMGVSGFHT